MPAAVLECDGVGHTFGAGALAEVVLRDVSAAFAPGEACVLMGPSGSGKTTLLSVLGCLLRPSAGRLRVCERAVDWRHRGRLALTRRRHLGFVFQHAQLLPFLTARQNLEVVGRNAGLRRGEVADRIATLLDRLGVAGCAGKMPDQLSGGQQQRLAIARAVLHRPPVLLADEPTAALDWAHGLEAVKLLVEQARSDGAALLTVTHDARLLPHFDRRLVIDRGRLTETLP
jgi:ABC-type lipoprotein export system ATPase subunit